MYVYSLVLASGPPKLKRTGDAGEPATHMREMVVVDFAEKASAN